MSITLENDVISANKKTFPTITEEIIRAKQFLKHQSSSTGDTLYEHLAELIQKILNNRPDNIVDCFEEYSREHKEERFKLLFDRLQDEFVPSDNMRDLFDLYKTFKILGIKEEMEVNDGEEDDKDEEKAANNMERDNQAQVPNILESNFFFQQAGFGLPDYELFNVAIALRKLAATQPVTKIRFFGKIFGTINNYYVAETELSMDEMEKRIKEFYERGLPPKEYPVKDFAEENEENIDKPEAVVATFRDANELMLELDGEDAEIDEIKTEDSWIQVQLPPIPVSKWEPPVEIAREKPGEGCNKKAYWVCNKTGDDWVCLPDTSPEHINVARNVVKYMTGNLDTEMHTYPPINGTEKDYLRAQIARIAAATAISPLEYYVRGIEGEEVEGEEELEGEEDDKAFTEVRKNRHYEGHTIENLTDKSLAYWVHHGLHILKQGRTSWWNPLSGEQGAEDEEIEKEEEEEGSEIDAGPVPELGPRLLSHLAEDDDVGDSQAWSLWTARSLTPIAALASLQSRRWPGAYAYATTDGRSDYIYIGWGVKYLPEGYSPPPLPKVCDEYTIGPEVMECPDPTVDEEEAFRIAHLPPLPPEIPGEDDEMEGEEVVEDEEEED